MYLVAIAWLYVALMMAVAEATAPQGSVLGALFTFFAYGVMPVAILLYILGTPGRKARLRAQAAAELQALRLRQQADEGGHAAGTGAVAPEREEA